MRASLKVSILAGLVVVDGLAGISTGPAVARASGVGALPPDTGRVFDHAATGPSNESASPADVLRPTDSPAEVGSDRRIARPQSDSDLASARAEDLHVPTSGAPAEHGPTGSGHTAASPATSDATTPRSEEPGARVAVVSEDPSEHASDRTLGTSTVDAAPDDSPALDVVDSALPPSEPFEEECAEPVQRPPKWPLGSTDHEVHLRLAAMPSATAGG